METCVRGFSFMPVTKIEVSNLQYIESKELERTWKISRRQRVKEQEQKVWEEFVKEQDVVKVVSNDDPYQFLQQLPESCIKELMEEELTKTKKEVEDEENIVKLPSQGDGDAHQKEEVQHSVTFADDADDSEMFLIFDDDKDDPSGPSGPEDELVASSSPCTVRERDSDTSSPIHMEEVKNHKSAENVTNVIESSIYCAKVKDLRLKIRDEMFAIIETLQSVDVGGMEAAGAARAGRRSREFSARFTRIHMYKLQTQIADVKRHSASAPAFARHTHYIAQTQRLAALHQQMLHSLQVFHKSIAQTLCVRETAGVLHSVAQLARDVTALCAELPAPPALPCPALYSTDDLLSTCDRLDEAVCNHSLRVSDLLTTEESQPPRKNTTEKKRSTTKTSKSISEANRRFSMYSLDTLRVNVNAKSSSSNNQSGGTSKQRCSVTKPLNKNAANVKSPKSPKTPRNRKPLMGGGAASPRLRARLPKDSEIATMVETVETCTSSRMSREPSPHSTPRSCRRPREPLPPHLTLPLPHRSISPETHALRIDHTPRKSSTTPRQKPVVLASPNTKSRRRSPRRQHLRLLDSLDTERTDTNLQISPVTNILCAKRNANILNNEKSINKVTEISDRTDRNADKSSDKVSKGTDSVRDNDFSNFNSNRESKMVSKDSDSLKDERNKHDSVKDTITTHSKVATCVDAENAKVKRSSAREGDGRRSDGERRFTSTAPASFEVSRLLRQLCSGDSTGSRHEKVSGAKNAQLHCVSGGSPRQPSTPQLLRILEETIQKKVPRSMYQKPSPQDVDRFRMTFNVPEKTADHLYQYRNKFVQHMLASSMYANSAVSKPWEMIGSVSDSIIDELLLGFAQEMEIKNILHGLYNCETK